MKGQHHKHVIALAQPKTVTLCATTKTTLGPDIDVEYSQDEMGRTVRRANGAEMDRVDVLTPNGWADWKWYDPKKDRTWFVNGTGQQKNQPAPVGVSRWHGKGPTIPASADCKKCHTIRTGSIVAGIGAGVGIGPVGAGVSLGAGANVARVGPTRLPAKADVCATLPRRPPVAQPPVVVKPVQGPPGKDGVPGRDGADGKPGRDGTDADMQQITLTITQWLDAHKGELRGKDGRDGVDGAPGTNGRDGIDGKQGPAGKDGATGSPGVGGGEVDIDVLIEKLPPIIVNFMDRDGVARSVVVRLGGKLDIPPVRLNFYDDLDGSKTISENETFRLVEPLGEPLKVEVTGGINAAGKKVSQ